MTGLGKTRAGLTSVVLDIVHGHVCGDKGGLAVFLFVLLLGQQARFGLLSGDDVLDLGSEQGKSQGECSEPSIIRRLGIRGLQLPRGPNPWLEGLRDLPDTRRGTCPHNSECLPLPLTADFIIREIQSLVSAESSGTHPPWIPRTHWIFFFLQYQLN